MKFIFAMAYGALAIASLPTRADETTESNVETFRPIQKGLMQGRITRVLIFKQAVLNPGDLRFSDAKNRRVSTPELWQAARTTLVFKGTNESEPTPYQPPFKLGPMVGSQRYVHWYLIGRDSYGVSLYPGARRDAKSKSPYSPLFFKSTVILFPIPGLGREAKA